MIAAALASTGPGGPLPPYPEALRCAALTEASARLANPKSEEGRERFDKAIFWGMAASEAAQKAKLTGARFTRDQLDWGAVALAELKAGKRSALAELEACRKRVPRY